MTRIRPICIRMSKLMVFRASHIKAEMRIQPERKEMRNRQVLSHRRKADFEVADVTSNSELLQTRTAAKGKARSPAADL